MSFKQGDKVKILDGGFMAEVQDVLLDENEKEVYKVKWLMNGTIQIGVCDLDAIELVEASLV